MKTYKVSRSVAINIVKNHLCITDEIAKKYTDSELKEVLKQLNLKANF